MTYKPRKNNNVRCRIVRINFSNMRHLRGTEIQDYPWMVMKLDRYEGTLMGGRLYQSHELAMRYATTGDLREGMRINKALVEKALTWQGLVS